ncbi:FkbM family methyltransferase [Methylobacterium sp. CM6244]
MAYFISYAQNCEDVMLWRALGSAIPEGEAGFYVDLGAGDPTRDSVTLAFYDRGWRGINVEANPRLHACLQTSRPRDINLNLIVGENTGTGTLYIAEEDDRISSTVGTIIAELTDSGRALSAVSVRSEPLSSILTKHAELEIHFLKIDVEGAEYLVLKHTDFTKWRPWIVVVEALNPTNLLPSHSTWESILIESGYHFVYFDGLNRFYVANEQGSRLDKAFEAPPNVRDGYVRSEEATKMQLKEIERTHTEVVVNLQHDNYALQKERDACLAERDQNRFVLNRALADYEKANMNSSDQENETSDLRKRISILTDQNECLTAERDGWMQEMYETNRHLAYLAQERQILLEQLDRKVQETEQQTIALSQQVQAIWSSTSWKITGPMRRLMRLLGRAR